MDDLQVNGSHSPCLPRRPRAPARPVAGRVPARTPTAVAGYVIRGGEEGRARLSVIGAAPGTSTADVLAAATVTAEMEAHVADPHTIVAFPRIYQVFGRRPA